MPPAALVAVLVSSAPLSAESLCVAPDAAPAAFPAAPFPASAALPSAGAEVSAAAAEPESAPSAFAPAPSLPALVVDAAAAPLSAASSSVAAAPFLTLNSTSNSKGTSESPVRTQVRAIRRCVPFGSFLVSIFTEKGASVAFSTRLPLPPR